MGGMAVETKLSHTAAMILQAIHAGYVYGFSVMEMTGLPSGTVYPAMRRLERDELIRSHLERKSRNSFKERYYEARRNQRKSVGTVMTIAKALTQPANLFDGLRAALERAAAEIGEPLGALLARASLFIFSTTQATNAILEGTTARTAFLCTEGFPDILVRREGGSLRPYDYSREFPAPYVPRRRTRGL